MKALHVDCGGKGCTGCKNEGASQMSMSMQVVGIRSVDQRHKDMLMIARGCAKVACDMPKEVSRYFDGLRAESVEETSGLQVDVPTREWSNTRTKGYDVDVSAIPKGVKTIRFHLVMKEA